MTTIEKTGAIIFGFDYQIDAAICLFLKRLRSIKKIKVEGKYEDIEQILDDGSKIYCQVKSVIDDQKDSTTTIRKKLKDALTSLSKCILNEKDQLLYCSNQKDLLISKSPLFSNEDILMYQFSELDDDSKKIIKKYFKGDISNLEKLIIIKIPYKLASDAETRCHYINREISSFLVSINENEGYYKELRKEWHEFLKGTAYDQKGLFSISKKEMMLVVLLILLDKYIKNEDYINDISLENALDEQYEELKKKKILSFEIFNKLQGIFYEEKFKYSSIRNEELRMIFNDRKNEIITAIYGDEIAPNELETETSYSIFAGTLRLRSKTMKIKEVCCIED